MPFDLEQQEAGDLPVSAAGGTQRLVGERRTELGVFRVYRTQLLDRGTGAGEA
ncbi:MAG: hypothetical protein OXH96_14550 [Spirochaetaceae bacterium]|nr:hypothetical protein [Spirochaetaceae bacterium]